MSPYDAWVMTHSVFSVDPFVLNPVPWAGDDALARVMTVLNSGSNDRVLTRLVGGAVRNGVMGRVVHQTDYDLATILTPDQVTDCVTDAGMRAVPTGIDHGTVTVVCDGRGFEVTTLRSDVTTDGRRATVSFTDDWTKDAARRDFTMNALYADLDGGVYDPLMSGIADARAGRVRFVGDATLRIAEDYLRILRFFRFHAQYGVGEPDRDAVAACAVGAPKIHTLSRERVTGELLKWLGADDPVPTLRVAAARGVMRHMVPAIPDLNVMARVVRMQSSVGAVDVLARLFVMMDGYDPEPILRLSRVQSTYLKNLEQMVLEPAWCDETFRRDIYRYGYDTFLQRLIVDVAERDDIDGAGANDVMGRAIVLRDWPVPRFPITGAELLAQGVPPGPALGVRLRTLEQSWMMNDFELQKE